MTSHVYVGQNARDSNSFQTGILHIYNDSNTTIFRLEVAFPLQSTLVCSTSPSVEAGDAALALVDVDVTAYFLMLRGVGSALLH